MQRALTIMALSSAHGGRLVLVAVLMGLIAAAVLVAGDTAQAQATTHRIVHGSGSALQTSLNAVFASGGGTVAAVTAGDTIEFTAGTYEDIGRATGAIYLQLDKANLTVRGARDPRLGQADGQCNPATDTILTGASGFELRASGITVEHFCFQDIDDGSLAHANPHDLGAILAQDTADDVTIRRNRIDSTIGGGVNGSISSGNLSNVTIAENEFIDIGLIENNGAGTVIQPRHSGQEPSAIVLHRTSYGEGSRITDNLFEGSAWAAVIMVRSPSGTISGNTFRNMAKSAVQVIASWEVTLDNNIYEGNNHAAWRVVRTANWLNDLQFGISGETVTSKSATMESEALQTLMRMTRDQAVAAGMDGDLYDAAAAAAANTIYRDPDLHAAVLVGSGSLNAVISNSTFTNNHNSIAICGGAFCRVDGLETVGAAGDTGRAPAYIAPYTARPGVTYSGSTITLSDNQFSDSDTRSFDGPGSIGNHLLVGNFRAAATTNAVGSAAGGFVYAAFGASNSFTGSGLFGGTIADDFRTISIASASAEVVEGADIDFNLTFDPALSKNLTIDYSVSEVGSWLGTLRDDDPTLDGAQITVATGSTTAVLTVPTVADVINEADGSITVTLGAGFYLGGGTTATVDVRDGPATHRITRGGSDTALQTSLNKVFDSGGGMLDGVEAGDTIEFGPGEYEDIGRQSSFYLRLNRENLTVRGARDPRLGQADGECDPTTDTILKGSSGFDLRAANITVEHFCFEDIDDGSSAHANPQNLAPILARQGADGATIRRNRIDNTIGMGLNGRIGGSTLSNLNNLTIAENEFIEIGLIATNGAGTVIQPRHTGKEPSAIQLDTLREKTNLTVSDNLFEGSAWAALRLEGVQGGTISGNTFRNMAKSAISLSFSPDFTLDGNTYEGNNRAAWRVVRTADWLNDTTYGISGVGTLTTATKRATMESEALQTLMRMTRVQAVAAEMDGGLYDAAAAAAANTIYRDPDLHAAVRVSGSANVTISNSVFSDNHNSIAICGDYVCRVEGLEAVGDDGDTGRAPAYIAPTAFDKSDGGASRTASTVTLSGNRFHNSDTRSVDEPGSVGNHLVIGYFRADKTTNAAGGAAGSFTYGAGGNSYSGSGAFGGAVEPPTTHRIERGNSDAELTTSLNAVFGSDGDTLADVKSGDTIEFGPGEYEDIGRTSDGRLQLDKVGLTVRGASDPRFGEADGDCDPTTDTILKGSSGFELRAAGITVEQICFENLDDGSLAHANPHFLAAVRIEATGDGATVRRNRINNTIGMGVDGLVGSFDLERVTIAENEFIDIGLIENNGAGTPILPRGTGQEPSAIGINTLFSIKTRIVDSLFERSAWVGVSLENLKGGTVSGNTFRKMAKSAVSLSVADGFTLDDNTYVGNNHTAWRVVGTADWLNDATFGLSLETAASTTVTMESAALQTFLRMDRDQAVTAGMDGGLFDATTANTVYRDPDLHAAVRISASVNVTISESTFTKNHNSIAICGDVLCRVEGLSGVGTTGDTGRAPAYISPRTHPAADGVERFPSSVTLSGNRFTDSDTRTFGGPGSIGNHLVIGYHRADKTNQARGPAVGSFIYEAGNTFTGDGAFGGAATSHESGISIVSASAEVVEGADIVFKLTLDPPPRNRLIIHYSVSQDGSWHGPLPDDSTTLAGTQIIVQEGVASAVLRVPTVADGVKEENGSLTVTIEPGSSTARDGDYRDGAVAAVIVRDDLAPPPGTTPPPPGGSGVAAPPPIFIPPPPPFRKDEVAVVDGAAKLEANKVTVDLVKGSLPENAELVEATVTKLTRSKTPDAPDGGRFRIASGAVYEVELEATLADETTQTLTELAAPATVCLPIPRNVDNPVVLRYDDESEEWVKLRPATSSEEDLVCALTDEFSIFAVADEADHTEGLSVTEINDFSIWEADYTLTASDLLAALLDVNPIWVRSDETWTGYATFEGEPIPGAIDFLVANGDTLWLSDAGSGGDTDEEDEEDEG